MLMALFATSDQPAISEDVKEKQPETSSQGSEALLYISDYFSFVGEDERGHVAFVLDNNRGQDGDAYQAEHFSMLHEEQTGWIEVAGNGAYENVDRELITIPNSDFFRFTGIPREGITITSAPNHLVLRIDPIPGFLDRTEDQARFWMGSAPAVLEWGDRTLKGRIIYEYLYKPDFNRLTRTYWGLWKDFQGFYLSTGRNGDFYLHSQQSEKIASLVGRLVGFSVFEGRLDKMDDIRFEVLQRKFTLGFYRWPTEWRMTWTGNAGSGFMQFKLTDRHVLSNWVIGGFAMGIVQGEILYDGRKWPFYGIAELLM